MIAYVIEIQNLLIFISMNLTNLSQVAKLNSVYFVILWDNFCLKPDFSA